MTDTGEVKRSPLGTVARVLVTVAFFCVVAWLLNDELAELDVQKIGESLGRISKGQLALAALLTAVAYGVLTVFDVLARDYVGHRLPLRTTVAISFISYAFNFNIGGIAGAVGFRYRLYSKHGIRPADIAAITLFAIIATWAGWLLVLGSCLLLRPQLMPEEWGPSRIALRAIAVVLVLLPALYLWACAAHRREMRIARWKYRFPELRTAIVQVAFGALYWLCPSAVIWSLQPDARSASFSAILASYLLSAMAGLLLHVPAGLGVFEAVFLRTLGGVLGSGGVVAMLLTYRGMYLLIPLAIAAVLFFVVEVKAKRVVAAVRSS